jgi:hypothetical protein
MNSGPFMVDLWPYCQMHLRESNLLFWRYHTIPIVLLEGHTHLRFDPRRNQDSEYKSRSSNSFSPSSWPEDHQGIFDGWEHSNFIFQDLLSRHFGILSTYLPRDRFLPSELVVPLVAQCHRSTTVHSYGPSGELERHYAFIHSPLPRFRRNRDRLHEKSTQTCQVTQTWIFYFRRLFDEDSELSEGSEHTELILPLFGHWWLWRNDCHRHLLQQ